LPSRDELNALCKWAYEDNENAVCNNNGSGTYSLSTTGGFSSASYWSSSTYTDFYAWFQFFDGGGQFIYAKGMSVFVRPVRSF
jgi:hypothetical protein